MNIQKTADIVIIGGGVMGASTAYHLASMGVKNVLLLEKEEYYGQGATGRCAGGVRYQFSTEINVRLSLLSLPMLEAFEEQIGQSIDYRQCGYLILLTSEQDLEQFKHNVHLQHSLGVKTQWLGGEEVRKLLPLMNLEDVLGATFHPKDGLADPNSVVMGYINGANRSGAVTLVDVEVIGINHEAGKIVSVETTKGKVETPLVVNAAGPWAGELGRLAGINIPITPLRRQMLTTTPLPEIPPDFPFVIDFGQSLYFHREGEGLLTGMSNPNEVTGFNQEVDPDWEITHLEAAAARLPLLENAGLQSHWAGLYENTPDAHPILGSTPIDGFYICAGFSGHGFMHGPVTGLLMSELIVDGQTTSLDISVLDLDRFESGRLITEYNVI